MNNSTFKIGAPSKRLLDASKLSSVLDGAVADQVDHTAERITEQVQSQARNIRAKSKPEPKTQVALCLAQSVRARISMLAAQKTTATGGEEKFSNQDIMEQAIMEYLNREEAKMK